MSSKRQCETCPIEVGIKDDTRLRVCGDPSLRCVEFRGLLDRRVSVWERFSQLAELSRNGSLDLGLLREGDRVGLLSSLPGQAYGKFLDRILVLDISGVDEERKAHGLVVKDTYNDLASDHEDAGWAVPEGEEISIAGARVIGGESVTGEIHVGRMIDYTWRDSRYGINLQEVKILDTGTSTQISVFGTDPSAYRSFPER